IRYNIAALPTSLAVVVYGGVKSTRVQWSPSSPEQHTQGMGLNFRSPLNRDPENLSPLAYASPHDLTSQSLRVLVLVACVAVALTDIIPPPPPSGCVAFCPHPNPYPGAPDYICCDPHPGRCPRIRSVCPFSSQNVPECSKDYDCPLHEKCCEDACLYVKVCKLALH
ncbi:putative crustin-like antimicrobial peptide 3, partial [Homarus americanus]